MADNVAIVHDYLTQRGGAERVVLAMLGAFPGAPLYTLLYEPTATFPAFANHDVRPLWPNRVAALRHDHRRGLPLYPLAISRATVDAEVTLCSSSGFAHGIRTTGRKVVYCYTPARWLYEEAAAYLASFPVPVQLGARAIRRPLRAWDRRAARSADTTLTSSTVMQARIARHYGIEAQLVPPPIGADTAGEQRPIPGLEPGFLVSVGRLLGYKNVDVVVAAMTKLQAERLVVVGVGPELPRLRAMAGPNVTFLGEVDEAELRWLYERSAGLVSSSFEDFGLTPLEAAAHGRPAVVLRSGGFLDTVVDGRSGVFFDEASPEAVAGGIAAMLSTSWDPATLTAHASRYAPAQFAAALTAVVADSSLATTARVPGPLSGARP
jgi:glycosyltransferase involved in cell wall biosynthesis